MAFIARLGGLPAQPVIAVGPSWAALVPALADAVDTDASLVTLAARRGGGGRRGAPPGAGAYPSAGARQLTQITRFLSRPGCDAFCTLLMPNSRRLPTDRQVIGGSFQGPASTRQTACDTS